MDLLKLPRQILLRIVNVSLGIVSTLVSRLTKPVLDRVNPLIPKFKSTTLSLVIYVVVLVILLWISIFFYWSFYHSFVPTKSHSRDINLIFGADCDVQRGLCSFPSANMSLVTGGQQPILARGQKYAVHVELDMPESPVNRELGMFIVKLDFYTKYGEVVRSAHRSAVINYKSTLLRIAEIVFFLPLYLLGYYNQKQNVEVQLYNTFTEDPFKPTLGAFVEVQSRFIEIYEATLKIEARFTGLRYAMFAWPLTSAVIGVGILMTLFTVIALLSWYNLFWTEAVSEDETGRVNVKYFAGAVDEQALNPETIGVPRDLMHEEGVKEEEKVKDDLTENTENPEEGPLAAQLRRRQLPQT